MKDLLVKLIPLCSYFQLLQSFQSLRNDIIKFFSSNSSYITNTQDLKHLALISNPHTDEENAENEKKQNITTQYDKLRNDLKEFASSIKVIAFSVKPYYIGIPSSETLQMISGKLTRLSNSLYCPYKTQKTHECNFINDSEIEDIKTYLKQTQSIKYIISHLRYIVNVYFLLGGNKKMFTEKFNEFLNTQDITAYQVAKKTGISQGLMNEYKNGVKLPTIQNLVKIADSLDCSVDFLLGRTDVVEVNRKRATFADYGELAALGGIDNPKPPKKKPETT